MDGFDTYGNFYTCKRNTHDLIGPLVSLSSVRISTHEPCYKLSSISSSDGYIYGFNGKMKVNEWAGSGNHNTALFWEYDVRIVRRGNRDPVVNPQNSPYSVFNLNPLMNNDVLGDVVKTDVKGWVNTKGGIEGILHNKKNPIDYNPTTGELVFNDNLDISNYTYLQKNVINRYEKLIKNLDVVTTIRIVGRNDEIITADGKEKTTLSNLGANGWTSTKYFPVNGNDEATASEVYITDKPVFRNGEPEKDEYAFTVNIHEVAGHAYQNLTNPPTGESANIIKIKNTNNKEVEKLMNEVFKVFRIDGSIWYKGREADNHKEYK